MADKERVARVFNQEEVDFLRKFQGNPCGEQFLRQTFRVRKSHEEFYKLRNKLKNEGVDEATLSRAAGIITNKSPKNDLYEIEQSLNLILIERGTEKVDNLEKSLKVFNVLEASRIKSFLENLNDPKGYLDDLSASFEDEARRSGVITNKNDHKTINSLVGHYSLEKAKLYLEFHRIIAAKYQESYSRTDIFNELRCLLKGCGKDVG